MATRSDQPLNQPRIVDVLDPGTGTYTVMVLMPTHLASKYPDKPWGTGIESIGLSAKDANQFPGYVLVDFEPMKGSPDLFWVFQNLTNAPSWTTKSTGQESLIPQKYRKQITTVRTKKEVVPSTLPLTITGDLTSSIVEQQDNTGKALQVNTTEVIQENASVLEGEEYGALVTQTVEELIVVDGTDADSGLNVISSTVSPLGNGKSIKQTKKIKGVAWPDPIDKEVSKDAAGMPPLRYRKNLTQTTTTRKIATSAIPNTPSLINKEVVKSYKKETPDRAEETLVVQDFVLNATSVDEAVEQKPYVKIVSRMTPGTTAVVPLTGNGSAKLVWEGPDSNIYENVAEVATIKSGLKGVDTDAREWGSLITTTNYTDSSVAPLGGSTQLIYNDGAISIYEASTSAVSLLSGSFTSAEKTTPIYKISETTSFSSSATATGTNNKTRLVFSLGSQRVFENTTTVVSANQTKVYYSVINAQKPSVLTSVLIEPIQRKADSDGNPRRDKICVQAIIEEGYSGLFPAKITEYFTTNPSAADTFVPLIFKTKRIDYDGINYQVSIGETLHNDIIFVDTIGTNDPEFESAQTLSQGFRTFEATVPPTIPGGWQDYAIQIDPFEDGYIVKTIQIKYA